MAEKTYIGYVRTLSVDRNEARQLKALASLLTTYEMQNAKEALPGLATDVSDFNSHLKAIQNAFLHILEINQNTEECVKIELQQLLSSKDNQIVDLQRSRRRNREHKN